MRPRGTRCVSSEISRPRWKKRRGSAILPRRQSRPRRISRSGWSSWLGASNCTAAVGVLELDRVLDASPDELDRHRLGLKSARRDPLELIFERTEVLLGRMNTAVGMANSKVLFQPEAVAGGGQVEQPGRSRCREFHELLGIESGRESSEARPWREAAAERWDSARATGVSSVDGVKNFGGETRDQARSVKGKLSNRIAQRKLRSEPRTVSSTTSKADRAPSVTSCLAGTGGSRSRPGCSARVIPDQRPLMLPSLEP